MSAGHAERAVRPSGLDTRAEILKLARTLRVSADELSFLEEVGSVDLRTFREQATDVLFDSNLDVLKRIAAASRLVPVAVGAKISEVAFGPLLTARIAGLIDTSRAVDTAKRLPATFLADVSAALDPRRVSAIIGKISVELIVSVAKELAGRADWITLGRFVGQISDAAVTQCFAAFDEVALLRTAFVIEDRSQLDRLARLLPRERFDKLIPVAAQHNLWGEALGLSEHLSRERLAELAEVVAAQSDEVLDTLARVVSEQNLWADLLPLATQVPDETLASVAAAVSRLSPQVRQDAAIRARTLDVFEELGPIGAALEG